MKQQIQNEFVKMAKAAMESSTTECTICEGDGKGREHIFQGGEAGIAVLDTPCKYCDGAGGHVPVWYSAGVINAIMGHAIGAALQLMNRQDYHAAEMYLSEARDYAVRGAEAAIRDNPELKDEFAKQMQTMLDEFSRG